jgi:hypothetical protein
LSGSSRCLCLYSLGETPQEESTRLAAAQGGRASPRALTFTECRSSLGSPDARPPKCAPARFLPHALRPETLACRQGRKLLGIIRGTRRPGPTRANSRCPTIPSLPIRFTPKTPAWGGRLARQNTACSGLGCKPDRQESQGGDLAGSRPVANGASGGLLRGTMRYKSLAW